MSFLKCLGPLLDKILFDGKIREEFQINGQKRVVYFTRYSFLRIVLFTVYKFGWAFLIGFTGSIMFPEDVIFFVGDEKKPKTLGFILGIGAGITLFLGPISGRLTDLTRLYKCFCCEIGKRRPFVYLPHILYILSLIGRIYVREKGTAYFLTYAFLGIFGLSMTCVSSTAYIALYPDLFHPSQYDIVSGFLGFANLLGGAVAVGVYGFLWKHMSYSANVYSAAIVGLLCCLPMVLFNEEEAIKLRRLRKLHDEEERSNRKLSSDETSLSHSMTSAESSVVEEESDYPKLIPTSNTNQSERDDTTTLEVSEVQEEEEDEFDAPLLENNETLQHPDNISNDELINDSSTSSLADTIKRFFRSICLSCWDSAIRPYLSPFLHWNFFWVFLARFVFMFSIASFQSYLLYYLRDCFTDYNLFGNTTLITSESEAQSVIGIVVMFFGLVSSFLGPVIAFWIDRKWVVSLSGFVMVVGTIGMIVFRGYFTLVVLFSFPMGFGMGSFYAVDMALQNDALPDKDESAKDLAIFSVATNIPFAVAAPVLGVLIEVGNASLSDALGVEKFGYYIMFGFGVFVQIVGSIMVLFVRSMDLRKKKKKKKKRNRKNDDDDNVQHSHIVQIPSEIDDEEIEETNEEETREEDTTFDETPDTSMMMTTTTTSEQKETDETQILDESIGNSEDDNSNESDDDDMQPKIGKDDGFVLSLDENL